MVTLPWTLNKGKKSKVPSYFWIKICQNFWFLFFNHFSINKESSVNSQRTLKVLFHFTLKTQLLVELCSVLHNNSMQHCVLLLGFLVLRKKCIGYKLCIALFSISRCTFTIETQKMENFFFISYMKNYFSYFPIELLSCLYMPRRHLSHL